MSPQTDTGLTARTWRVALIVFLTVLLGGTGLSGAAALWSKQATVTGPVATGTWSQALQPGWVWNPTITATSTESSSAHRDILVDWQPPAQTGTSVRYTMTLTPRGQGRIQEGPLAVAGDASAARYTVHHNFLPDTFVLTVTATVDGVTSAPVTRHVHLDKTGAPVITAATG